MFKRYIYTMVIFWTLILLPALITGFYEVTDNFNYRTVAFVKYYQNASTLPIYEETPFKYSIGSGVRVHPLHELHFLIMERVLGLDAKVYQNFPIGIMLVILYVVILAQFNAYENVTRAICLVPFATLVYTSPLIGTYIPTYGFIMLLSLLIVLLKFVKKYGRGSLIAMLILIIALNFTYYTAFMALASILASFLLLNLMFKGGSKELAHYAMILAILLMLFTFNEILYETIEKITLGQGFDFSIYLSILRLLSKINPNIEITQDPYVFTAPMSRYYSILNLARVISLIIITTMFLLIATYRLISNEKSSSTSQTLIFTTAVSTTPFVTMLTYVFYGGYPRYDIFFFVYPIIASVVLTDFRFKELRRIFASLTILVSLISAFTYMSFMVEDRVVLLPYSYKDASYASHFLSLSARTEEVRILSDFRTIGIFTVLLAENGLTLKPLYFDSNVYDALLKGNISSRNVDFIIINKKLADRPVTSIFWYYYHPLEPFISIITRTYEVVYNDAYLYIVCPFS